jgi:hypothetical protein
MLDLETINFSHFTCFFSYRWILFACRCCMSLKKSRTRLTILAFIIALWVLMSYFWAWLIEEVRRKKNHWEGEETKWERRGRGMKNSHHSSSNEIQYIFEKKNVDISWWVQQLMLMIREEYCHKQEDETCDNNDEICRIWQVQRFCTLFISQCSSFSEGLPALFCVSGAFMIRYC